MTGENPRRDCAACTTDPTVLLSTYAGAGDTIGRRTFLVQSGILAAMTALAACAAVSDSTAPNIPSGTKLTVSDYPALSSVGGVAMVSLGGAPVAIVRTSTSSFLALSRVCPHQGGIVDQSGSRFVCPVHGATFDLNGTWIGGQRTSSLHQYPTSYDATTNSLTIG